MTAPTLFPHPVALQKAIADAQKMIPYVMDRVPALGAHGWDHSGMQREGFHRERAKMIDPDFAKQVATAEAFIQQTFLGDDNSYALKHAAERWGRENGFESYVSNGAFIMAAINSGYEIQREADGPNCIFRQDGMSDIELDKALP